MDSYTVIYLNTSNNPIEAKPLAHVAKLSLSRIHIKENINEKKELNFSGPLNVILLSSSPPVQRRQTYVIHKPTERP